MKGDKAIVFMLLLLGSVHADSVTSLFNISGTQKHIENIKLSLPPLNNSDIPAWVDEWEAPKIFQKMFPFYISGYDFDGSPVYVLECGHWKVAEGIRSYKDGAEKAFDLLSKYVDQTMNRIYGDGLDKNGQGVVLIIDYDGFAIANIASSLAMKVWLRILAKLERIYNVLNYGFWINMNFAGENLLQIGRPLLGNFMDKCEVFGSQKYKWLPHLARKIPTNQLSPWYGGPEDWQPVTIGLEPFNSTRAIMT